MRLTDLFYFENDCTAERVSRSLLGTADHPRNRLDFFDLGSAPRRSRGSGEDETRGGRTPGRFPVGRAERPQNRPGEPGAKTPRGSKKTRFYFVARGKLGALRAPSFSYWTALSEGRTY